MKGSLKLTITKLIRGRYSYNYYEKCKKFKNQPPFIEPLNEHFISHNLLLFLRKPNHILYTTDSKIAFSEVPFLSPLKSVLSHYGKPTQYSIHQLNSHSLSIIGYSNRINSEKSKTILYLLNNKLLIGEYLFQNITEKKYNEIFLHYIFKKYLKNEVKAAETVYIEDKNRNLLCINWNGFDLSIKYMCVDTYGYLNDLKNYYDTSWKLKLDKENDNLADFLEIPSVIK